MRVLFLTLVSSLFFASQGLAIESMPHEQFEALVKQAEIYPEMRKWLNENPDFLNKARKSILLLQKWSEHVASVGDVTAKCFGKPKGLTDSWIDRAQKQFGAFILHDRAFGQNILIEHSARQENVVGPFWEPAVRTEKEAFDAVIEVYKMLSSHLEKQEGLEKLKTANSQLAKLLQDRPLAYLFEKEKAQKQQIEKYLKDDRYLAFFNSDPDLKNAPCLLFASGQLIRRKVNASK